MTTGVARTTPAAVAKPPQLDPRREALCSLIASFDQATAGRKKAPEAQLEQVDADLYKAKGGYRAVAFSFDFDDQRALNAVGTDADRFLVDEKKGVFFASHRFDGGFVGPFPLPKEVTVAKLLDDGKAMPRVRSASDKALAAVGEEIRKGFPEALRAGRSRLAFANGAFRGPDHEKLTHHYIQDPTGGRIPGGALMVGKRAVWMEMIPGVSGEVYGPFPLPKGMTAAALRKALETSAPQPKKRDRSSSEFDDPRRFPLGNDSGRHTPITWNSSVGWVVSPGGRPS